MFTNVVVLGGGRVGSALANDLHRLGGTVTVVDLVRSEQLDVDIGYLTVDVNEPSESLLQRLRHAQLVVVALPGALGEPAIDLLSHAVGPDALIVDTLADKGPVTDALERLQREVGNTEFMGIDPVSTPQRSMRGIPVITVEYDDQPDHRKDRFLEFLEQAEAVTTPVKVRDHSRLAVTHQSLPHALLLGHANALAVADALVPLADPPTLLVARSAQVGSELYWNKQNVSGASRARGHLIDGLHLLDDLEESWLFALLDQSRHLLGEVPGLRKIKARTEATIEANAASLAFAHAIRESTDDLAHTISLAPPPFRALLVSLNRTVSLDTSALLNNQLTEQAYSYRGDLIAGLRRLDRNVKGGHRNDFDEDLVLAHAKLAGDIDELQSQCADLFYKVRAF